MDYEHEGEYAELHAHSNLSFLDGAADPEALVSAAVANHLYAIALTDHNGLYGVPRFVQAAAAESVTALVGAELTLDAVGVRRGVADPVGVHLVVLATSITGYRALSRVITKGQMTGEEKGRFVLSMDDLAAAAPAREGWTVLTGCRKGPLSRALLGQGPQAVERSLLDLVDRFGRDAVVVECFDHGDPIDTVRNEVFYECAIRHSIPAVATQNVHAITAAQQRSVAVAAAIRANRPLAELDGYLWGAGAPRMQTPKTQHRRFARFPGLVSQTREIADRCRFPISLVAPGLPRLLAPEGIDDATWLRRLTFERAPLRYGPRTFERVPGAYRQLDYELDIIDSLSFAGYFLVVCDLVDFCKRETIYCQGRGSAANSAVCYALGITNADPVALGLLFERFLSPERDGPPDIDVDIESGRREEVIQYVYSRYGREYAAQVASVITYRARSVLRDVARVYGATRGEIDRWSRQVERRGSLAASLAARDHRGRALMDLPAPIAEVAQQLENAPRHLGLHVGGMVICDRPIVEVCPTEWARKLDRSVLQWDKDDCARMGLVKFDLLGLGMLSAIHNMVDLIQHFEGIEIDIALIPQDPGVYELLQRADSIGIFQVESRAQMATLPRLQPTCFYDLVVEVALIRPGPIQGGSVHPYLRRRAGEEEVTYLHPLLERSLAKTLGVPLFQEQLMQMAMDAAGFTPAQADELRQAMSAKRSSLGMQRLRERLFVGMRSRGIDDSVGEQIYEKLAAFANFGFPESHAASFAYLVYVSAWLKLHHPVAFYAGLLRAQPMGFWSPQTLVQDARRHGVVVAPPDVMNSEVHATLERVGDGQLQLRIGLAAIRGVGVEAATRIVLSRPVVSLVDLVDHARLSEIQIEHLAAAGALRSVFDVGSRREAIWRAGPATWQRGGLADTVHPSVIPQFDPPSREERYSMEMDAIGFVSDGHPIELLRSRLHAQGVVTATGLVEIVPGAKIVVAGVVTHRQRPGTAKGVVFLNLEDETGLVNVLVRPGVWVRFRTEGLAPAVIVKGTLQRSGRVMTVIAREIVALENVSSRGSRDFC
ncbi:MAG: error-prone DNA polymerase [Ferrimicrobium sp.]